MRLGGGGEGEEKGKSPLESWKLLLYAPKWERGGRKKSFAGCASNKPPNLDVRNRRGKKRRGRKLKRGNLLQ